jgi:hypothetical protein
MNLKSEKLEQLSAPERGRSDRLGLENSLVHQHDGDIVFHRVYAMTSGAFQRFRVLAIFQFLLASRADEHFKKVFSQHELDCTPAMILTAEDAEYTEIARSSLVFHQQTNFLMAFSAISAV